HEDVRQRNHCGDGELRPRRDLVAKACELLIRGTRAMQVHPRAPGWWALVPDRDVEPATGEAIPRPLLDEKTAVDELRREPHAHVEESVIYRSRFDDDLTWAQRRIARPKPRHRFHSSEDS